MGMQCDDIGMASDPLMRTDDCRTPILACKIVAAISIAIILNTLRVTIELLCRLRALNLSSNTFKFMTYSGYFCSNIFLAALPLAVLIRPGVQPFPPVVVWCLGIGVALFFVAFVGVALIRTLVATTAQLIYAIDPQKGMEWQRGTRNLSLAIVIMSVFSLGLSSAWLCSAIEKTRAQGAALFWSYIAAISFFDTIVATWFLLELRAVQVKVGNQGATEMKTDLKIMKITIAMSSLTVPFVFFGSIDHLRRVTGAIFLLVVLPFVLLFMNLVATMRLNQARAQMLNLELEQKVTPKMVDIVVQPDITAAIQQSHESEVPEVCHSGVTLRFLEQFYAENNVQVTDTADDVVNQHVKPHTKDPRGDGTTCTFAALIQGGSDASGCKWAGRPTHMVSYSWRYTMATTLDILRKYEADHPPVTGVNRYVLRTTYTCALLVKCARYKIYSIAHHTYDVDTGLTNSPLTNTISRAKS
jgi:hypothetical protein